jgi:hypothetical protein
MMIFIVCYLAYRKQVMQIISAMRAYELDLAWYFWINFLRGVEAGQVQSPLGPPMLEWRYQMAEHSQQKTENGRQDRRKPI